MTCSLLAARHDPALHSDPHRFNIERADTTHLAVGGGAHYCRRAPLARAEAEIAIATLLERSPHSSSTRSMPSSTSAHRSSLWVVSTALAFKAARSERAIAFASRKSRMTAPLHWRTEKIAACLADPFDNGEGAKEIDTFTIPDGAGGGSISPAVPLTLGAPFCQSKQMSIGSPSGGRTRFRAMNRR
jgi:hypothetical protein